MTFDSFASGRTKKTSSTAWHHGSMWGRGKKFLREMDACNVVSEHLYQTNGRFPVKLGSDRRETLPERVSSDFGRVIFRRQKKNFGAKISDENFCFLPIWRGFWRATAKRTSKSASGSNFAPDRLILRSVRPNIVKNGRWFDTDGCHTDGRTQR